MKKDNYIFIILLLGAVLFLQQSHKSETNIFVSEAKDDKLDEPSRYYDSRFISRKQMRINQPTRGEPPSYQQVGILTDADNSENIKPLYGRQTYRGSGQWNYFTALDSHLATKIPIYSSDKDCTDEHGCKEIYKNDVINIGEQDNGYKATIYNTIAPRYIPY